MQNKHQMQYKLSELYTSHNEINDDDRAILSDKVNRFTQGKYALSMPSLEMMQLDDKLLHAIFDRLILALPDQSRKNITFDACFDRLKKKDGWQVTDAYAEFTALVKARINHMLDSINHPARIKAIQDLHAKGLCRNIKLNQSTD